MNTFPAARLACIVGSLLLSSCLNAPRPALLATTGDIRALRGVTELAVYASDEDMPILKAALLAAKPSLVFTTADMAQVIIHFQTPGLAPFCIDCGPGWSPGIVRARFAFATVQRHGDSDHCSPKLLRAEWSHEAYSRKALIRAFAASLKPFL